MLPMLYNANGLPFSASGLTLSMNSCPDVSFVSSTATRLLSVDAQLRQLTVSEVSAGKMVRIVSENQQLHDFVSFIPIFLFLWTLLRQ